MTEKKTSLCACGRNRYSKHDKCHVCRRPEAKKDLCACGKAKCGVAKTCLACRSKRCEERGLEFQALRAEHTLKKIGEMYGISKQAVCKAIQRAQSKSPKRPS